MNGVEPDRLSNRKLPGQERLRFRGPAAILYLAFVMLFGLGYAAAYIHPQYVWWLQLIAPLLPYLTCILAAATFAVLRSNRTMLLLVHGLFLLLAILRFPPNLPRNECSDRVATGLGVISLNAKGSSRARSHLEAYLDNRRPHVIGIQEAQLTYRGSAYGVSGDAYPVWRYKSARIVPPIASSQRVIDLPIFSTLGWWSFKEQELLNEPGVSDDISRAELLWEGRNIVVYNVHLRSYLPDGRLGAPGFWINLLRKLRHDVIVRAWQAEALRKHLESEADPFLVLADLNATRHNWSYRHVSQGLKDTAACSEQLWRATFPSRVPLVRIDHVFASPHWCMVAHATGPQIGPDHRPVYAEVDLQ